MGINKNNTATSVDVVTNGTSTPTTSATTAQTAGPATAQTSTSTHNPTDNPTFNEMNSLWREIDEMYHAIAVSFKLSESAFDVMYAIYVVGEGCTQRNICDQVFLTKQTINTSLHKLVQQGFLVLKPAPHGRSKQIFLTNTGRELIARCIEPVAQAELDALVALNEHDRELLLTIAKTYIADLRKRFIAITKPSAHTTKQPTAQSTKKTSAHADDAWKSKDAALPGNIRTP